MYEECLYFVQKCDNFLTISGSSFCHGTLKFIQIKSSTWIFMPIKFSLFKVYKIRYNYRAKFLGEGEGDEDS
jgi:hypothetical protein